MAELKTTLRRIRVGLRDGSLTVPASFWAEAQQSLDMPNLQTIDQLADPLLTQAEAVLRENYTFLAVKGGFHGKTTGSLQLTYNPDFRLPWSRVGLQSRFLPINDAEALRRCVAAELAGYWTLDLQGNGPALVYRPWSNIISLLIEPIQGEGGIHLLEPDYLQAVRAVATEAGFPLMIDEIQSGMGRSGRFLASASIKGDIYLFSKSLGGSLAKIGAMLVEKSRYIRRFGYLHSSTFADDDFSSEIALATLDLIEADDQALIKRCGEVGGYLIERLNGLAQAYPSLVAEVRGKGLMVGIELAKLNGQNPSRLLNIASEQDLLPFLLCGYLLHAHQIRVAPTLSASNTIRIEPSAFISYAAIDQFCDALSTALDLIAEGQAGVFLCDIRYPVSGIRTSDIGHRSSVTAYARVACIAHFVEPEDLTRFDPRLGPLTAADCERLLARTQRVMGPFVAHEQILRSQQGDGVNLTIIGIPYTAAQIETRIRNGTTQPVLDAIGAGVEMAKRLGAIQVGFTGYTSIVTQNCTAIVEDEIGCTSGNSLTVAAASSALHQALDRTGAKAADIVLGLVGGIGNIGQVLALIEADRVGQMVLIGRRGRRRLEKLADQLYREAWLGIKRGDPPRGIAQTLLEAGIGLDKPPTYTSVLAELGADAPIEVSLDLNDLQRCNGIISATNAPQPIILPAHIGEGPVVICDVAVPQDVDPAVAALDRVTVIEGGILKLPQDQALEIPGLILPKGEAYACISEAVILGMAGINSHFSYGPLRPERVREIDRLAKQFGFKTLAM